MSNPIIASTKFGKIKGLQQNSCYGKTYNAFLGVPYARQPIGDLRFHDPEPLTQPWNDVFDATKEGSPCHQFDKANSSFLGGDECLNLNIFTKSLTPSTAPVMVYIHGGGYRWGSASTSFFGPDYLMEHDVVLVTINYRILLFGLLSLPAAGIGGNATLKDQNMALRWVKQNISSFGGDSENVTLFGESAGAVSVHYHLLSPMSEGLFHRAIMMSGSVFSSWSFTAQIPDYLNFAKGLGYVGDGDEVGLFKFFQNIEPTEIVRAESTSLTFENLAKLKTILFLPVVDGKFITKPPEEMALNAWGDKVDVIFGCCSQEGLLSYAMASPKLFAVPNLFESILATSCSYKIEEKAPRLQKYYYQNDTPTIENIQKFIDLVSDKMFLFPIFQAIKSRSGTGKNWLYRVDVEPSFNLIRKTFNIGLKHGTAHIEDILFVFKHSNIPAPEPGSQEYTIIQKKTKFLTNFARSGNHEINKWQPIEEDFETLHCLNITNTSMEYVEFPEMDRVKFWSSLCDDQS